MDPMDPENDEIYFAVCIEEISLLSYVYQRNFSGRPARDISIDENRSGI